MTSARAENYPYVGDEPQESWSCEFRSLVALLFCKPFNGRRGGTCSGNFCPQEAHWLKYVVMK